MQQTENYNLNKFDSTDKLESATRLGLNENADIIDEALTDLSEATGISYDNTESGLTAETVQGAIDEIVSTETAKAQLNMYGGQTVVDAGELKSAQANKVIIGEAEKNIPAEVIALDGYGMSAGTVYNSVEWVDGRAYFHKRVTSVDLGSLTWSKLTASDKTYFRTDDEISDMKKLPANTEIIGLIASKYITDNWNTVTGNRVDKTICSGWKDKSYVAVYDTGYSTAEDFKTALNGVMLYYELATEEVTEITSLFPSNFNIFSSAGDTSFEFVDDSIAWVIPYDVESRIKADDVSYDNSVSGLSATNVQAAINELYSLIQALT